MTEPFLEILKECLEVADQRSKTYGSAIANCEDAAKIMKGAFGVEISPKACCMVMIATKLARGRNQYKRDNLIDCINYFGILTSLYDKEENLKVGLEVLDPEKFEEDLRAAEEEQQRGNLAHGGWKSDPVWGTVGLPPEEHHQGWVPEFIPDFGVGEEGDGDSAPCCRPAQPS